MKSRLVSGGRRVAISGVRGRTRTSNPCLRRSSEDRDGGLPGGERRDPPGDVVTRGATGRTSCGVVGVPASEAVPRVLGGDPPHCDGRRWHRNPPSTSGVPAGEQDAEVESADHPAAVQVAAPRSFIDLGGNDHDSGCDDCRADVNCGDNEVNAEDLGYLLSCGVTDDSQCDLDGDGTVSAADLALLSAARGRFLHRSSGGRSTHGAEQLMSG